MTLSGGNNAGLANRATFNINDFKRLPNLLTGLRSPKPDVVSPDELKAEPNEFPENALRDAGYTAAEVGQNRGKTLRCSPGKKLCP